MSGHRHTPPGEHEHEFEAQEGLPEPLPKGERLLWQGTPDWRVLGRSAFHTRKLAIYFIALLALRAGFMLADGRGAMDVLVAVLWLGLLFGSGYGMVAALAWFSARSTMYTITDKRVVMRIGIVLTVTFNLPHRRIVAAGLHVDRNGFGDIPLTLNKDDQIGWFHLWPHTRPWRIARPEPMLRALPDVQRVATLLTQAWSKANGVAAGGMPARAPVAAPAAEPVPAH